MTRTRIAVATSFPTDPATPHGGVEAVSVNLVRWLARNEDLDIHVVTTQQEVVSPQVSEWAGATIHRLPWTSRRVLRHATGPGREVVCAYLRQLRPDLIHAHDIYGLMVKGLDVPRVFTIHGFIHGDTLVSGQRLARIRAMLWKRIELAGWADQPHIVSINPYVREHLEGWYRGEIHDIENPIDEECFHLVRDEQPGTIFSAALVCPRKNTLGLIEAFALLQRKHRHARLRLAGSLVDAQYAALVKRRIADAGLNGQVEVLGRLTVEQVRRELSRAAVFTLLSFEEGAPMGISEAMAAGVPVVASNRCGMPHMIDHGHTGLLVEPDRPEQAAEALEGLLEDDVARRAMGTLAQAHARESYHPAVVAAKTRALYLQVLGASSHPVEQPQAKEAVAT